jgi:hypothetical protein
MNQPVSVAKVHSTPLTPAFAGNLERPVRSPSPESETGVASRQEPDWKDSVLSPRWEGAPGLSPRPSQPARASQFCNAWCSILLP